MYVGTLTPPSERGCNSSHPTSSVHLDISFAALALRAPLSLWYPASSSALPPVAIWPHNPIPNGTNGLFSSSAGGAVSQGRDTTEIQQQAWQYPWRHDVFFKSDSHPHWSVQQKQTLPITSHSPTLSSLNPARLNLSHSIHLHLVTSCAHSWIHIMPGHTQLHKRQMYHDHNAGTDSRGHAGIEHNPAANRLDSPVHQCIRMRFARSCTSRGSPSLPSGTSGCCDAQARNIISCLRGAKYCPSAMPWVAWHAQMARTLTPNTSLSRSSSSSSKRPFEVHRGR
eukprot:COSAG02_NODE_1204_length_13898_cov_42.005870_7_plen_282_part_00